MILLLVGEALIDCRLKRTRIDLYQCLPGIDSLVIGNGESHNVPADLRRDDDGVCLRVSVVGRSKPAQHKPPVGAEADPRHQQQRTEDPEDDQPPTPAASFGCIVGRRYGAAFAPAAVFVVVGEHQVIVRLLPPPFCVRPCLGAKGAARIVGNDCLHPTSDCSLGQLWAGRAPCEPDHAIAVATHIADGGRILTCFIKAGDGR